MEYFPAFAFFDPETHGHAYCKTQCLERGGQATLQSLADAEKAATEIVNGVPVYTFYRFTQAPNTRQLEMLQTFWNITTVIDSIRDFDWRIRRDMDTFRDFLYVQIEREADL